MGHSLYEMTDGTVQEQIDAWREVEARAQKARAALEVIQARFPDAVDHGPYNGEARWMSHAAHELADMIDGNRAGGLCCRCLYIRINVDGIDSRIYSSRPVNFTDGLNAHQAGTRNGTLLDCLKATTRDTEAKEAQKHLDEEAARLSRETQAAVAALQAEQKQATRVIVLGEVKTTV